MDSAAVARVATWGAVGAWGLLPQALIAVALTVLAAQSRMRAAVGAYALALAALLAAAAWGVADGLTLMKLLNALFAAVALACLAALGTRARACLPWREMALALVPLLAVAAVVQSGALAGVSRGWPAEWAQRGCCGPGRRSDMAGKPCIAPGSAAIIPAAMPS